MPPGSDDPGGISCKSVPASRLKGPVGCVPQPLAHDPRLRRLLAEVLARVSRIANDDRDGLTTPLAALRTPDSTRLEVASNPAWRVAFFDGFEDRANDRLELVDRYVAKKIAARLSPKTVTNTLTDLNVMLKQAVRWRLIRTNPVVGADRPRREQPDMNILTEDEIAQLRTTYAELEASAERDESDWWRIAGTITFFALGTAMRRGEILALRWRDVKMLEGLVQVREAYVRGQFTTPKSRASRRTIELGPKTRELLSEHWKQTPFKGDAEIVFCHPTKGTPLDPSRLSRIYMRPALKKAEITKPFRPWHDLRHTALTHEAAAGNPQAYVQLKAGHSQGSITERYIHAAQVLFPGAAEKAEARMFGVPEPSPEAEGVESG
jgi:integrase